MLKTNIEETTLLFGGQVITNVETAIPSEMVNRAIPEAKEKGTLITVAEMGRILGLKKTERYWLLHKGLFETRVFLGKTWVVRDSFEKWYANQTRHHKVSGEAPGRELLEHSYGARDIAGMLGLSEATVYEIIKRENFNTIVVDHMIRVPKEVFENWYAGQERYRTHEDRNRYTEAESASITMPEMARLLGVTRKQVYMLLNRKCYKDIFDILVIAGKKRITRESFERFLEVQDRYRLCEERVEETQASEQQYLDISEAAELIHVPENLLYRWIREGAISSRKVGRKMFLERSVLEEWQKKAPGLEEKTVRSEIPGQISAEQPGKL